LEILIQFQCPVQVLKFCVYIPLWSPTTLVCKKKIPKLILFCIWPTRTLFFRSSWQPGRA